MVKNIINYDILIPAYNAGRTISNLLSEIHSTRERPQNIFVIDDGSTDDTVVKCQGLAVKVISHKKNLGKGRSLKTGFEAFLEQSGADYVLCLDADMQHPVSSIPDFLAKTEIGTSFVVGARERSLKFMPVHRILSNIITSLIISLITGQQIKDSQCGYRLIHRNVFKGLELNEDGYQMESEMLLKTAQNGVKIDFIPIPTIYNAEKSHMRNFRDTLKFIRLIFRFLLNSSFKTMKHRKEK
jgi:glycosyltransferase involved in cell wall biosynthesis